MKYAEKLKTELESLIREEEMIPQLRVETVKRKTFIFGEVYSTEAVMSFSFCVCVTDRRIIPQITFYTHRHNRSIDLFTLERLRVCANKCIEKVRRS